MQPFFSLTTTRGDVERYKKYNVVVLLLLNKLLLKFRPVGWGAQGVEPLHPSQSVGMSLFRALFR